MCGDFWNFGGVSGEDWGVFRKKGDIKGDNFLKIHRKSIFRVSFWLLTLRIARQVHWSLSNRLIILSAIGDVLRGNTGWMKIGKMAAKMAAKIKKYFLM